MSVKLMEWVELSVTFARVNLIETFVFSTQLDAEIINTFLYLLFKSFTIKHAISVLCLWKIRTFINNRFSFSTIEGLTSTYDN